MAIPTTVIKNLKDLYNTFSVYGALSASMPESTLSSNQSATPKIHYGDFKEHVFFDNAIRKVESALTKIKNEYPIGISGTSVSSLNATDIANVQIFNDNCTEFEKYVLNYLGGVSGLLTNQHASITASATISGNSFPLVVVYRNLDNSISGGQAAIASYLETMAEDFENGYTTVENISGTAHHDIAYEDRGESLTSRIVPSFTKQRYSRNANLVEMMPDAYFYDDENDILEKYLAVIGRTFDSIKVYADELVNLNTISYDKFHSAPDGLFQAMLARQYGIDLIDSTLNDSIQRYISSVNGKQTTLKISNTIFYRILNNIIPLLKYKGTKEAIESIIRIFGIPHDYLHFGNYEYFQEERESRNVTYPNARVLGGKTTGRIDILPSFSAHTAFNGNSTIEARVSTTGALLSTFNIFQFFKPNVYGMRLFWDSASGLAFTISSSTVSLPSSDFSTIKDLLVGGTFVNVFGIRENNTIKIKASWIDESSGTATLNTLSNTASVSQTLMGSFSGFIGNDYSFTFPIKTGYVHEVKGFSVALNDIDCDEHTRNFESISISNSQSGSSTSLRFHYKLKENKTLSAENNYIIDSSGNGITGYAVGSFANANPYALIENMRKEVVMTSIGHFVDNSENFTINDYNKDKKVHSSNVLSVSFNPIQAINDDIENVLGNYNSSNLISDPRNWFVSTSSYKDYPIMGTSAGLVFSRYNNTKLDLNGYINAIENFGYIINGITYILEQFIPARVKLISKGIFIEQHALQRSRNKPIEVSFNKNDYNAETSSCATTFSIAEKQESAKISVISEDLTGNNSAGNTYTVFNSQLSMIKSSLTGNNSSGNNYVCFDTSTRALSLTGLINLADMWRTKQDSIVESTLEFYNVTGNTDIYSSNTGIMHTTYNGTTLLPAYYQDVSDKNDTSILFTTNKNIIENSTTLASDPSRSTITGNIKLIRNSSGKIITCTLNTVRIEFPRTAVGNSTFSMTANNATSSGNFNYSLSSKNGVDFVMNYYKNNYTYGIENVRIINLLSGNSQVFPIIVVSTSSDLINVAGGGQLTIRVGKVIV